MEKQQRSILFGILTAIIIGLLGVAGWWYLIQPETATSPTIIMKGYHQDLQSLQSETDKEQFAEDLLTHRVPYEYLEQHRLLVTQALNDNTTMEQLQQDLATLLAAVSDEPAIQ